MYVECENNCIRLSHLAAMMKTKREGDVCQVADIYLLIFLYFHSKFALITYFHGYIGVPYNIVVIFNTWCLQKLKRVNGVRCINYSLKTRYSTICGD